MSDQQPEKPLEEVKESAEITPEEAKEIAEKIINACEKIARDPNRNTFVDKRLPDGKFTYRFEQNFLHPNVGFNTYDPNNRALYITKIADNPFADPEAPSLDGKPIAKLTFQVEKSGSAVQITLNADVFAPGHLAKAISTINCNGETCTGKNVEVIKQKSQELIDELFNE